MRLIVTLLLGLLCLAGCSASQEAPDQTSSTKRIALTYDDVPRGDGGAYSGLARTEALIKAWDDAQTGPVGIFVTTQGLVEPGGRDRIAAYAAAGHLIANHSHTHPWASRTDTDLYIADIDRAEAELNGFTNRRAWFRFPYLDEGGYGDAGVDKRDALRAALKDRNLMNGYVTVDTYDWHLNALWQDAIRDRKTIDRDALSELYVAMVVDAADHYDAMAQTVLGRRPAQVLLLHENDLAAAFTVDMVAGLREAGWMIIGPDEAYTDPIHAVEPETRFGGMGRISAMARDAGHEGAEFFDHWSVSEAEIDARVVAAGVFSD